jgi:hypothetical protein
MVLTLFANMATIIAAYVAVAIAQFAGTISIFKAIIL